MNSEKLSKRLEKVVSYVSPGMSIADIGSDHAYLPCYAVKKGITTYAIAGEVVDGPFQSALAQVKSDGLEDRIDVRKGNGLSVLEVGETDAVIIAGMGGALITDILEQGKEKLKQTKRLILQPNLAAEKVRKWLLSNDWELKDEGLIEEDEKYYEILVAEPGVPRRPYKDMEKELLLGPYLLHDKTDVFQEKWNSELKQWQQILQSLEKAEENDDVAKKEKELRKKIKMVKEALN